MPSSGEWEQCPLFSFISPSPVLSPGESEFSGRHSHTWERETERVRRKDTHGDRERDRGQETENRERAWATSDHSKLGHWLSTKSVAVSAKGNRIALLFMMSSFRRLVAGTFLAPLAVAFKLSLVMW